MSKSRWIVAIAEQQTVVLQDTDGCWRILWKGVPCTPSFNSKGAAEACLTMYRNGTRKPELPRGEQSVAEASFDEQSHRYNDTRP